MAQTGSHADKFIQQGFVSVSASPCNLISVVATGLVVTAWSEKKQMGGMCNYTHPRRQENRSNAVFAAPALFALIDNMIHAGAGPADLEIHVYGASENPSSPRFVQGHAEELLQVTREILQKLNVWVAGMDVGGKRARKIVFNPVTGETIVAKVSRVRDNDWYPHFIPEKNVRKPFQKSGGQTHYA